MKRHPFDPLSLIGGLAFVALGLAVLLRAVDFTLFDADWVWPGLLIAAGIGILLTLGSSRGQSPPEADHDESAADATR